ncbi:MAG TPA: hypothetical protein VK730_09710 [Solirubrobacteraceae bacterium]|nr:hypothetical protein [Solirubrobacteraceae bacterium]
MTPGIRLCEVTTLRSAASSSHSCSTARADTRTASIPGKGDNHESLEHSIVIDLGPTALAQRID